MKIFDTKEIREIDAYTIQHEPVASTDLMERAAGSCTQWIAENISKGTQIIIFTGPGNNGGDGWVIGRLLSELGFKKVTLYHLQISQIISPDSEINLNRLVNQGQVPVYYIRSENDFPIPEPRAIIVDALFGSGLTRPLEGLSLKLIEFINHSGCRIISIDVPSGLFGEDNSGNPEYGIIRATDTLTFQFPKRSFFFSENEKYTGKWHIISIGLHPDVIEEKQTKYNYVTSNSIRGKLKKRKIFSHKGLQGHALLIAGSYGMMGAAILAAKACLRTGTGLVTSHVPASGYPIIQTMVPESTYSIDPNESHFSRSPVMGKYSAIAAGPGIGTASDSVCALELMLTTCDKPLVLDADAINILASHPKLLNLIPANTILTPHPGEFDRLAGISINGFTRNQCQIEFSKKNNLIIVLKGAYSSISLPDGRCYYNSTGNPGMATAGSGDVLTGMILSLLAQGYAPDEAAVLGTFIHGLAGDIAAEENSQQAMIASDIINNIGNAFKKIEQYEKSILL